MVLIIIFDISYNGTNVFKVTLDNILSMIYYNVLCMYVCLALLRSPNTVSIGDSKKFCVFGMGGYPEGKEQYKLHLKIICIALH